MLPLSDDMICFVLFVILCCYFGINIFISFHFLGHRVVLTRRFFLNVMFWGLRKQKIFNPHNYPNFLSKRARKMKFGMQMQLGSKSRTMKGFRLNVVFEVPGSQSYLFPITMLTSYLKELGRWNLVRLCVLGHRVVITRGFS